MIAQTIETRAQADSLLAHFLAAGAVQIETTVLQPAQTLLDLYGEDIRARAYVTSDAQRGEQVLRPDFTVPVVQMHMAHGADPARYTYCGKVFRRQDDDEARPNEYLQVGFEIFDRDNAAQADAEVFATIASALRGRNLRAATGDIGILLAAVDAIDTTERRRMALRRHIWRPRRFRALLDRFSNRTPPTAARSALLAAKDPLAGAAPLIGLRSREEIEQRIEALREDAATPPISTQSVALIDAILSVRESLPFALERLRDISVDMPALVPAVERLAARMQALSDHGVKIEDLAFETSFGRGQMEYYDGFVFEFTARANPDWPAIATGGRYDALTRILGGGREIPAVGGVIRPGLLAEMAT